MILVTGATGNLGKATIDSLLNRGIAPNNITALVRDESKAAELKSKGLQIKLGDYQDLESLKSAFRGVDKLLLVSSSSDIGKRFEQHKNAINAANESGVGHIIYTSFDMKNLQQSIMGGEVRYHAYTADYLRQTGIPYTLMNNTMYADMIPFLVGKDILNNGISIPAGDGKTPFLPISEMAEANAVVLTTPGHENKEYIIASETAFSFAEIADLLSDISGKTLAYHQPDVSAYVAQLIQAGLSEDDAAYIARFCGAIARGEFDTNKSDVKRLLGRSPVSLKEFLQNIYS
ncbi:MULTISPECIES: SDR family oxidoreductase [Sphingobacterium]|jgi:NAD(P)H dehydrogenase (quinone)|uniref:Quinone oxidoreductase 2 n=2 Tax=Sphingobacterium multivorum TaxID=28454 RepID=A0A2X2KSG2_SPHMU|nr:MULTISPECIES: SDR family oxidoreductase [Sphingobacterium]HAE69644.1 SDR family NAD(P)-dependent oxidoreductase [Sphingobacterium sp.]OFV12069.1 NAD(P)-dependent oxidoreductase [Sphingobacterium sp. HMSC13C05]QQT44745.1 SDR family oxidoreductase [Sphingobacterium multivorum]QRQ59697.1 SDR family oxidoreductase [Sphingobacterium multivorum]SPZ85019.1 Quinone oxidoreductase 2 [Sphingobacterium multivorum]